MRALRPFLPCVQVRCLLASLLAILLILPGAHSFTTGRGTHSSAVHTGSDAPQEIQARAAFDRLPLSFESTQEEHNPSPNFGAHGHGYALALTPTEALLSLAVPPSSPTSALHFRFPGANPVPTMWAERPLPGVVNSFVGTDPVQWRTHVSTAARVRYSALYPGIDLTVYGTAGGGIEYDVIVAPGADPAAFSLSVAGATGMTLDATTGELTLGTAAGEVRQHAPVLYQEVGGERRGVAGGYAMRKDGTVGFVEGEYDPTLPLVIDPPLVYSTYLGGSGQDEGYGIAVDTNGNTYITGGSSSTDFPVTNGSTYGGGEDAFVTKLNATGARVYSTYLGGSGQDIGDGIAVDTFGNAYITGYTDSTNFPATNSSTYGGGGQDAFVTKLDGNGARVYSIYLGGSGDDQGDAIAVDTNGDAYVTGYTLSTNFPVTNGSTFGGATDAFVTKLTVSFPLTISPNTLPNGVLGTPYSQTITASGGTAPYTFAVTSGSLPPALPWRRLAR